MPQPDGLRAGDVDSVVAELPDDRTHPVHTRATPDINVRRLVVLALVDGGLSFAAAHDDARTDDPEVSDLQGRVEPVESAGLTEATPARQVILTVRIRKGRELRHHTQAVKGTPANPTTRDEVAREALDLVAPIIGREPGEGPVAAVPALRPFLQRRGHGCRAAMPAGPVRPPVHPCRRLICNRVLAGTVSGGTGMNTGSLSRAQIVYNWVKDNIRDGILHPGMRLRETEIAKALGVSRTPVREAINRLISEGQVVLASARGFAVAELEKQQVLEIYALREFLEGAAGRFAAQHAAPSEIETMRDLIERSLTIGEEPQRQATLNKRFHAAIRASTHNRYLEDALSRLADSLGLVPGTTFEMPGRVGAVYDEHKAILDAIEGRDPDRAERAAREHIRKAGRVRMQLLFDQE